MTADTVADFDAATTARHIADQVQAQDIEYDVLYRLPASDSWPFGDEVGFVEADGWIFAVNWSTEGYLRIGHFAIEPGTEGCFPAETAWMITNNDAIDYGLEAPDV